MLLRYAPLILLLAAVPHGARAQAVVVSPTTGTKTTHFILSASGWPSCGEGSTEQMGVAVDNHGVYSQNSVAPFSIDLASIDPPDHICAICTLPSGPHTIRVTGFSERGGTPSCTHEQLTLCLTFTIVDSATVGDPWALNEPAINTNDFGKTAGVLLRFFAQGTVGFPACDSVHLIQVERETALYHVAPARPLSEAEQMTSAPASYREFADSLDAWTTPAHYHIDVSPYRRSIPYQTIGRPYQFSKAGRTGTPRDTARVLDAPFRDNALYPDSVATMVFDFEVNAFCAAGAGRGQYLGRCIWQ